MKNVFFCLVILLFSGISITLNAQCITEYTSQNGGDFSVGANWLGGTAPANPIPPGVTVTIQHAIYNSGILENNGAIVITPSGSFTNKAGAIYSGNGTFTGSFVNQGTVAPGATQVLPTLVTTAVTSIAGTTAVSGGTICYDGGTPIIARGVCWSESPNPDINLPTKTSDSGNPFTSNITGLTESTTYYLRAYATNSTGTTYGNELIFSTEAAGDPMTEHFVTTWKTDNSGTSCSSCITIPTFPGETYNYDVDWDNDGTLDEFGITGNVTHDFGTAGTYTIRIRGDFPRIYFNNSGDREKILSVDQWGTILWTSMESAFYGCYFLNLSAADIPDLSGVSDCSIMFGSCANFNPSGTSSTAFSNWNTSNIINMSVMFASAYSFNQDISNWNTSNVTSMSYMFFNTPLFNQSLGNWNITNVSNLNNMLNGSGISIVNYDNMLIAWDAAGYTNKNIGVGGLHYCNSASARTNMITNKGWTFNGDALSCPVPLCTELTDPLNGATNVPVTTNLTWSASANASGYKLKVGTTSGGTEILNNQDVGNVLTYDLASDLPYSSLIYVTIIPYNATGDALGCTEESFTTESAAFTCGTSTVTFDYNGSPVTYGTVLGVDNRCWLDRNLGAGQVAVGSDDAAAFGDYFQWGRSGDGHQLLLSNTTNILSNDDNPGHSDFIISEDFPYDWRSPQNDNLWQGENGVNNPCPSGFRLPTSEELNAERISWSSNDVSGAFASSLKLPKAGLRDVFTALHQNDAGYYWSSSPGGCLYIADYDASMSSLVRGYGMSVRCIKGGAINSSIDDLDCDGAQIGGTFTDGAMVNDIPVDIGYSNGNGGNHSGQVVQSMGVTGLTASLNPGSFANGSGMLTYMINGTPIGSGTAIFTLNIGGQSCDLSVTVSPAPNSCVPAEVSFTYNGNQVTYGVVESLGRCWLDRNLGASQVATSSYDPAGLGDLFQWGRPYDGHQVRNPLSGTTPDLSTMDIPGHGNFILPSDYPYDWRSGQNDNLWQGVQGINNPCPSGYRIPTDIEWETELASWQNPDNTSAFSSILRLPAGGERDFFSGTIYNSESGYYWSSTADGQFTRLLSFDDIGIGMVSLVRGYGHSVRCIRDETPAGSIGSLDCPGATINGTLTEGVAISGVSAVIGYTDGNGGTYSGQTVASTGVTGLTATLPAGSFASGSGTLTYDITGTPASAGTAVFALNIGGQTCDLSVPVQAAVPICTNLTDPLNGATNVPVTTNLTWAASVNATGYKLTVGTTSGGTEILNDQDVGNVLTYDLASDLPYATTIYVTITPYNVTGDAAGCTEESFTAESNTVPFITTWKTDNPGTSCSSCITIPTFPGETYNYDVDWDDDGTFDEFGITGNVTHDFSSNGTYKIRIQGIFPRIFFNGEGDNEKLISIDQWGGIAWSSMVSAFYDCINMNLTAEDIPDLSSVTQLTDMFGACFSFNPIGNASIAFSNWNTQNITDMSGMFAETMIFDQPIGNWNTGVVEAMGGMFQGAIAFNQNLNSWNTENVTDMNGMFSEAHSFNQSLDGWNTGNVTDMSLMFQNANSFNKPVGNWNVSSVTEMSFMFQGAASFNQSLNLWNTGSVTHMDYMFHNAASYNQPISNFILSSVANMDEMLTGSGISTENYDNTLIAWDAAGYTNKNVGVGGLHYCNSASARNNMITNKGWIFNGDALSCPVPLCTALSNPVNGSINIPVTTNLTWAASSNATGYKLKVGTTSGGTEILNNQDVGNVLTYDLASDLPYSATIYLMIIPYNATGDAVGCTEESFTTVICSDLVIEIISTSISDDKVYYNYTITNNGPNPVNLAGPTTSTSDNLGFQRSISNDNVFGDIDDIYHGGSGLNNSEAIVLAPGASTILNSWFYNMHTPGFSHPGHSYLFIQLEHLESVLPCDVINNYSTNKIGCTQSNAHNFDNEADIDDGYCQTCVDGIQNGDETGTDCGGVLCPTCPFGCTNVIIPENGAINVPVSSNLTWSASNGATGYRLSVGTTSGGTDILNNADLGNVTTYDPPSDFPVSSTIYVTIIPYNAGGDASGCAEESFTTASSNFTCGTSTITFTYNGASVTYGTVVGANNKCWLDRNLGASQVAMSSDDAASYGDLFQWGRLDDGHQVRTSLTTTALSNSDNPAHSNFILAPNNPYDWRSPQNGGLWQGVNGINNPCPNGFRIPGIFELDDERASWTTNDAAGAYNSPLKLPAPGSRNSQDGVLYNEGSQGLYWSGNINGIYSRYLQILQGNAYINNLTRAEGFSIRCIKDETPAGSIGSLDCLGATINGTLTEGVATSGVSAAVGYTGGNGGTHPGQTVASTGVAGLTATLPAGSFANGAGTLTYDITGTPASSGTAVFTLNIGGQTCDLNVPVQAAFPSCTNLTEPLNGATNVPVTTNLTWASSTNATGYKLTVGTTSGATDILNNQDAGNVLTYDLASDLPYSATIYVTITPYNATGDANGCTEESFTTVSNTFNCGTSTVTFNYNGASVTYGTVMSAGRCWLDRNLGATRVAISSTDELAYGDLFQWGRLDDGHQVRTSGTTSVLSTGDVPGHDDFIIPSYYNDWRSPHNNNLWQGLNGINIPCPVGYRLPTAVELDVERTSWSTNNASGAFNSPLKLPLSGWRYGFNSSVYAEDLYGYYWSSTVSGNYSNFLIFYNVIAGINDDDRSNGYSVRCIKD